MVTRTETDHQSGVAGAWMPASIAPPERCIKSVRSPYGMKKADAKSVMSVTENRRTE